MKAAVYNKYGAPSVVKVLDIENPEPKENELLVKVMATTVTSGDVRLRSSDFPPIFWLPARFIFGLFKPKKKILGHEFSGVIEKIGTNITKFKAGDEVFGTTTMLKTGAHAQYICVPEQWKMGVIHFKPKNLSHQESAALPIGGMTALDLFEKGHLQAAQEILIYGASGNVGSMAVQIAKAKGAKVTAVCSGKNFEMVTSLGADVLIDYTKENYWTQETKFDLVFDAVGKTKKSIAKKVLKSTGKFVSVNMLTKESTENLKNIKLFAEQGKVKPFIDKIYPLDDIVKTHEYVDSGRKRGSVVIDIKNS